MTRSLVTSSAESGSALDASATTSVVRLERDQWIVTNTDRPTVSHHGAWLPEVLAVHRHAVAFHLGRPLELQYRLGDDDTAGRIVRLQAAGEAIAALRREAAHAEAAIRGERRGLMRELADLRVAPGEIAHILNVPTTAVPKELGTDQDVRLARLLLADRPDATDQGAVGPDVNRLF